MPNEDSASKRMQIRKLAQPPETIAEQDVKAKERGISWAQWVRERLDCWVTDTPPGDDSQVLVLVGDQLVIARWVAASPGSLLGRWDGIPDFCGVDAWCRIELPPQLTLVTGGES